MRKTRSNKGFVDETETQTISRLRSKKPTRLPPSTPRVLRSNSTGRSLRSKKRKLVTESNANKDDGRITRSRGKIVRTHHLDSEKPYSEVNPPSHQRKTTQQKAPTEEETSRPRMRSQLTSAASNTSPIRFRPSVSKRKRPALTAHVDTQHARHSMVLRNTNLANKPDDRLENKQIQSKNIDNLPDDNNAFCLSPTELIHDYEDLVARNNMVQKVNFGDTIESALSAVQSKLKQLEQYDPIVDPDVEEEMREYKRSLKSLAALRESECLVRLREMEQDRETHMRQLTGQSTVTPMQAEVLEMCDRKIWWVGEKEWLKGSGRSCTFGANNCAMCSRKSKISNNGVRPSVALTKMPRVSAFDPKEHEEPENAAEDSKKSEKTRRYNIRSIEIQKKASITRVELQRLHAALSFIDQYNRTGRQFLPE